ncbi:hypothetical protein [Streptomyces galilaeus]|uniref:hypothetical protein n=1 Tax=Streptomyces galilaeus TaxID=33899 RepID=UPI0038F7FAD7
MNDNEEQARFFVRTWAEAVLRQAERAQAIRRKAVQDDRNYERMEDWSPPMEVLEENFRAQWAEEHQLVWAAHQLERWDARLRRERGQEPRGEDPFLKDVRDALEHLDEVDFVQDRAISPVPVRGKKYIGRAIRKLPGGALDLHLSGAALVGGIPPQAIEARALEAVRAVEQELEQEQEQREQHAAFVYAAEHGPELRDLVQQIADFYAHAESLIGPPIASGGNLVSTTKGEATAAQPSPGTTSVSGSRDD